MPNEGWPTSTALCQKQGHGSWRRKLLLPPLTPDFPSLSEPARSTKLILEVMYFSSDKVREWAYETSKQRLEGHGEKLPTEQAP